MSILSCSPLCIPFPCDVGKASPTLSRLLAPLEAQLPHLTPLVSGSNRSLSFTFDYQVRALVYYHTEGFTSAQDLLQATASDPFAKSWIVPKEGLGESTFYEANATRGSLQMIELADRLSKKVSKRLKVAHIELGDLVAIDGSLMEASLSMTWADYISCLHKAKMHVGFDLNRGIPRQLCLTEGKAAERPFVTLFLEVGQTGVMDRGYQDHKRFDAWIEEGKHIVVRIRNNTQWIILEELPFPEGTSIFLFAKVLLGDQAHRMQHPVFLVGFRSRGKVYFVVTDREDLTAQQIAFIFSLRWEIETFFAWWKRHLKVYHLICRNQHGVLLQLLAGLITYLLLVLYFHQQYEEKPSIRRLRELRRQIRRETNPPIGIPIFIVIQTDIHSLLLLSLWFSAHAIF